MVIIGSCGGCINGHGALVGLGVGFDTSMLLLRVFSDLFSGGNVCLSSGVFSCVYPFICF